jgi:Glyoxalase-like domain
VITRFDHAVIGVRDLDSATRDYQRLGFDVRPGGRHTGIGTHNALIRFGLDYLELLAPYDDPDVTQRGGRGPAMIEYLRDRPGGLLGFALASNNLDDEAARPGVPELGYQVGTPFAMQRMRPDGRLLSWRILAPGAHTWRKPWPFLIQWDAPDEERLAWEGVGTHSNGARAVAGLTITAHDPAAVSGIYRRQLGLQTTQTDDGHTRVELPGCHIDLVQTASSDDDEGVRELLLQVADLRSSRAWFAQQSIAVEEHASRGFALPPEMAVGARLIFVA